MLQAKKIKRIVQDYSQAVANPQPGIAIIQENEADWYNFIVNMEILFGSLKGLKLQMRLILCENYPARAPQVKILEGQDYFQPVHHHVYNHGQICNDILSNAMMDPSNSGSGWSSAYNFSTLLLQLHIFFSNPDQKVDKVALEKAQNEQLKYSQVLKINGEDIEHTWDNPYPPFHIHQENNNNKNKSQKKEKNEDQMEKIKEKLTCYVLKENIFESDEPMILGYPIKIIQDKEQIIPIPIPEMLSLEGYIQELENKNITINEETGFPSFIHRYTFDPKQKWNQWNLRYSFLKTGFNEQYHTWLPIYLNKEHFEMSLQSLETYMLVIKNSYCPGLKSSDFGVSLIFEIFPAILNSLVSTLLYKTMHQSVNAIQAYIHIFRTFKEIIAHERYRDDAEKIIKGKIEKFCGEDPFYRHQKTVGNLGEFIQILAAWDEGFYLKKDLMDKVVEELMARQTIQIEKDKQKYKYKEESIKDEIDFCFDSQKENYHCLVFIIDILEAFGREEFYSNIKNDFTVLYEDQIHKFVKKVNEKIKGIDCYYYWFKYLNYKGINDQFIYDKIKKSYMIGNVQKYINTEMMKEIEKKEENKAEEELFLMQTEKENKLFDEYCKFDPFALLKDEHMCKKFQNQQSKIKKQTQNKQKQLKKQKEVEKQQYLQDQNRIIKPVQKKKNNENVMKSNLENENTLYDMIVDHKKQNTQKKQINKVPVKQKKVSDKTNMFAFLETSDSEDY